MYISEHVKYNPWNDLFEFDVYIHIYIHVLLHVYKINLNSMFCGFEIPIYNIAWPERHS